MSEVFILSAARSPVGIGKPNGALSTLHPVHLTAMVLQEAVRRAGVEMQQIEDVILGCVTPIGEQGANLARLAFFGMALFGVIFSIYLTYLEPFVIRAVCMWCLSSAVIMTLILLNSIPETIQALNQNLED